MYNSGPVYDDRVVEFVSETAVILKFRYLLA